MFERTTLFTTMFTAIIVVCSLKSIRIPSFVLIGCCVSELYGHICPYRNVWPEAVYYPSAHMHRCVCVCVCVCVFVFVCVCVSVCLSVTTLAATSFVFTLKSRYVGVCYRLF